MHRIGYIPRFCHPHPQCNCGCFPCSPADCGPLPKGPPSNFPSAPAVSAARYPVFPNQPAGPRSTKGHGHAPPCHKPAPSHSTALCAHGPSLPMAPLLPAVPPPVAHPLIGRPPVGPPLAASPVAPPPKAPPSLEVPPPSRRPTAAPSTPVHGCAPPARKRRQPKELPPEGSAQGLLPAPPGRTAPERPDAKAFFANRAYVFFRNNSVCAHQGP